MTRSARPAITVVFLLDGLLLGTWASRVPAVQAQAELSTSQLGLALFAASLGALLAMPVAGRLCERVGSRGVSVAGLALASVSLAGAAASTRLVAVALALLGFGAGFGSVNVSANDQGIALERIRGRAILSSFHAAFSAGGLAGAGTGALVAGLGVPPRAHVAAVAAAVLLGAAATGPRLLPPRVTAAARVRTPLRPSRVLLVLGAAAFCGLLAEGAAADWSAVFLARSLGTTAAVAGLGYTAFSLAMTASRAAGDRLHRRMGPVRLARGGAAVAAVGLSAGLITGVPAVALAGFGAMGAGLGVVVPVLFRAAGSAPGVSPSAGVAAVSTVGWLGFLAGPPAIGYAASAAGLRLALVTVVGAIALLALLAGGAAATVSTAGTDAGASACGDPVERGDAVERDGASTAPAPKEAAPAPAYTAPP